MAQNTVVDSESSKLGARASRDRAVSHSSASAIDQLTVLVFKDNSTPRTFRVPTRWITQFGWLLGAIFLTTLLSLGIAAKAILSKPGSFNFEGVISSGSGSSALNDKIHDLESQLKDAQGRIQTLSAAPAASTTSTAPSANGSPLTDPSSESAPVIDPALLSVSSAISARPFLFKGLPDRVLPPPEDASQIPITLSSPQARWEHTTLKVRFNLQYTSSKPGGQQGRILILARGPGVILSHPNMVLQSVGKDILIDPNKGEYFSVSRFRETKADFGPLPSKEWIKEVEVLVLSSSGQILIHRNIIPGEVGQGAEQ